MHTRTSPYGARLVAIAVFPLIAALCLPSPAVAFQTFEHFYLGEVAYKRACARVSDCDKSPAPKDRAACLQECGDLHIGELFSAAEAAPFPEGATEPLTTPLKFYESSCASFQQYASMWLGNLGAITLIPTLAPAYYDSETLALDEERRQSHDALLGSEVGIPLGFGDLTSLAGDFTSNPGDLEESLRNMRSHQTVVGTDLVNATRQHLSEACRWIERACQAGDDCQTESCSDLFSQTVFKHLPTNAYSPSRPELAAFEKLPQYGSLALHNWQHFPTWSWETYRVHHLRAIRLARQYAIDRRRDELLWAIIEEGFGQHFLQDSFASGHVGSAWGGIPILARP